MLLKTLHWNIGGAKIRSKDQDPLAAESYKQDGLAHISEVIAQYKPDIVTLVETHANEALVQAEVLAVKAGLPHFRNESYADSHVEAGHRLGFAVISRFPIIKHEYVLYTNPGFTYMKSGKVAHDKGALHTSVAVSGKEVEIVATHLTPFRRVNVDPRSEQAFPVLRDVAAKLLPTLPTVLMQGDFNIDSVSLREFFPELFAVRMEEVLIPEVTTPAQRHYDHVLYRGLVHKSSKVLGDTLADHYPVYSEFEF